MWSQDKIDKALAFCKTKAGRNWKSMHKMSRVHGYCKKAHIQSKMMKGRKSKSKSKSRKGRKRSSRRRSKH